MSFKRSMTFTCKSIKTILGVEHQEREVGVEDVIFIEFNNSVVEKSSYCEADILYYLKIQIAKDPEQFENLVCTTTGN